MQQISISIRTGTGGFLRAFSSERSLCEIEGTATSCAALVASSFLHIASPSGSIWPFSLAEVTSFSNGIASKGSRPLAPSSLGGAASSSDAAAPAPAEEQGLEVSKEIGKAGKRRVPGADPNPPVPLAASVADPPAPAFASGTAQGPSPGGAASPAPCGTSAEASPPTGGARRFGAAARTLPVAAARGSPAARWHATPAAAAGHRGWAQLGGRRLALTQHETEVLNRCFQPVRRRQSEENAKFARPHPHVASEAHLALAMCT
eukprot:CAMPEP_0181397444 /NCGR_PEP_ID=MMETSP1110-20121109/487_1 /TAXON_ID=174948 /ORGANISM="Symbiodinium sp., Strain CCMP421" /LENGTH=261 /DNA_ID=CAMNT_0023519281 /DNA_START=217 /DNA_END=1003 /DNA_ORIENTATION=+